MAPSEQTIASAVESLKQSPGLFQRLAEAYAQATYPQRFRDLIRSGRNLQNVPVKPWPDAYAPLPDGRWDAVEAAHTPRWTRHLDDDLGKAQNLGHGRLAGYLFVVWAHRPPTAQIEAQRARFAALGIPPDKVTFVFKEELVRDLRHPRFGKLWVELLHLPCECSPFRLMSQAGIFGTEGSLDHFRPTIREYLNGHVRAPAITEEVEVRLATSGWALVRGRGASGKTVLGALIALRGSFSEGSAYYLDVARFSLPELVTSSAHAAITVFADSQVLFIVDNVHLGEEVARSLFDHWQRFPNGSRLLLLGRLVSRAPDVTGLTGPLEDLEPEGLRLEVTPTDLTGVLFRLMGRLPSAPPAWPTPPEDALRQWCALFGGDLIAFSAAVARRLRDLANGAWELRAEDAADYVREAYLDPATAEERLNLLKIAAVGRFELSTDADALETGSLRGYLQSGILYRTQHGREKFVRFHLVHPGIGQLLLVAAGSSVDEPGLLREVAQRSPVAGMALVGKLELDRRRDQAASMIREIVESPVGLSAVARSGFHFVQWACDMVLRHDVLPPEELESRLVQRSEALTVGLRRTPLNFLVNFLEYAEKKLPRVHQTLAAALAAPENQTRLADAALRSPLHFLVNFLEYAERKLPRVHETLAAALAAPENQTRLADAALRAPLDILVAFLSYAETRLPTVFETIAAAIAAPENQTRLAETALHAPLTELVGFLEYAQHRFSDLSPVPHVETPGSWGRGSLGESVIAAIDRAEWEKVRLHETLGQPNYFHALVTLLQRLGRPELAAAPARALIGGARPEHWSARVIGLHHLTQTIRLGREAGPDAIVRFLDCAVGCGWLDHQYNCASSGTIAAGLFSVWGYQEPPVLARFLTEGLRSRLLRDIRRGPSQDPPDLSGIAQLLGCADLVGVDVSRIPVADFDCQKIEAAVESTPPPSHAETIGHIQIQLWLGLRALVRLRGYPVRVAPAIPNRTLALWKNSTGPTERHQALNTWMIQWLERCESQGWLLVPDSSTCPG